VANLKEKRSQEGQGVTRKHRSLLT
ncbi:uncharacterized protein METZ01_LOCUS195879, partial [marine metagenome]